MLKFEGKKVVCVDGPGGVVECDHCHTEAPLVLEGKDPSARVSDAWWNVLLPERANPFDLNHLCKRCGDGRSMEEQFELIRHPQATSPKITNTVMS